MDEIAFVYKFDLQAFDALCLRAIDRLREYNYSSIDIWYDGPTDPGGWHVVDPVLTSALPTQEL